MKIKKLMTALLATFLVMHGGLQGQVSKKENPQMEKRIQKLISKMTLKEKTGLLHGNSKFFVLGVSRLGIRNGVFQTAPTVYVPKLIVTTGGIQTGRPTRQLISLQVQLLLLPGIPNWPVVAERFWVKKPGSVKKMCFWARE